MELVVDAKIIVVYQVCESCKEGLMLPSENVKTSDQQQYEHVCNKCGCIVDYPAVYPYNKIIPFGKLREPHDNEK